MNGARVLRVVVVEDEAVQRAQVREWLAGIEDVACVGEAATARAAVEMIDATKPDLVLLDISLPEGTGIEVLSRIAHVPHVVFTTAFRDYAIEAFALGAVDYLLKPFGIDRLRAALERVRDRAADKVAIPERVASVMNDGRPLARLFARDRGGIVPISPDDIIRMEADGDYTAVVTASRRFLVALSLKTLHDRIGRDTFVRVHRQHVVNLAHVARIVRHDAARLEVIMKTGGSIVASRSGSQLIRRLAPARQR